MGNNNRLSPSGQVGLVLGVLLIFSLIMIFAGTMATDEVRGKLAAFSSDGAVATGTITKKYIHTVGPGRVQVNWLDFSFKSADGAMHNVSEQVANTIYDKYQVGSPVKVTYVKSKPEWFYVPGDEPTERDLGIMSGMRTYSMIAAVVFALGLVVWFFWTRDGGTSAGGTDIPPPDPLRALPRQPRAGFGGGRRFGA